MNEDAQKIGSMIRAAREKRRYSQVDLATALNDRTGGNYMNTTVGKIERGERSVSLNEGVHLADILGIPFDDFFNAIRPPTPESDLKRLLNLERAVVDLLETTLIPQWAELGVKLRDFADRFGDTAQIYDPAIADLAARADNDLQKLRDCYADLYRAKESLQNIQSFHVDVSLCISLGTTMDKLREERERDVLPIGDFVTDDMAAFEEE